MDSHTIADRQTKREEEEEEERGVFASYTNVLSNINSDIQKNLLGISAEA